MKELEALRVIIKNLNNNKTIDDIEFATMNRIIEDAECKVKNLHLQNVSESLPSDDEIKLTDNGFGALEDAVKKAKGNVR